MKKDIRKGIKSSFLYKRFAYYQSQGFIELMKFLENENLIYDFCEECNFNKKFFINDLKNNEDISIADFFGYREYSFSFSRSKLGEDFWYKKISSNKKFEEIKNKLL